MEKLIVKELDFVLEPTYAKINKTINNIVKELVNIVGKKYSDIINDRIYRTNFVFFNKMSDLKKYCDTHSIELKALDDKKVVTKYESIKKGINNYETKINKFGQKLRNEFILEIQHELSEFDQNYLGTHKKIDFTKLNCYNLFFEENSNGNLLDGLFISFSYENEKKLHDRTTSIKEMEEIFNDRERCLKLLGIKKVNIRTFDRDKFNYIFDLIDKYNREYKEEVGNSNLNKEKIIDNFLLGEKVLNNEKNAKVSKYFLDLLKKNKKEINRLNDNIINKIITIKEPEIIWASDNYSDDNNMRFLLFSPTMDFENNDYLFVREICRLAFASEYFNNKAVVQENSIIGKEKYLMFSALTIDLIAYQVTKRLMENEITIINSSHQKHMVDFDDGLFLVDQFYKNYGVYINESLINNDNSYIFDQIGKANFENYVNIINKYFYDSRGNLLPTTERRKAVFTTTIKNILNISLENMKQYKKILINKDKYSKSE